MAEGIRIAPEVVRRRSQEYHVEAQNIEEIIRKMDNLINQLESEWDGKSSEAFVAQYQELKPSFSKMQNLVEDISLQLKQIAENYRNFDSGQANSIRRE